MTCSLLQLNLLFVMVGLLLSSGATKQVSQIIIHGTKDAPDDSIDRDPVLLSFTTKDTNAVVTFNKYNFVGNVMQGTGDKVDNWVVLFCVDWYPRCRAAFPSYRNLTRYWQDSLNADSIFSTKVRFANVDCATDKELCKHIGIDDYPTAVHYAYGTPIARWTGDEGETEQIPARLSSWITRWMHRVSNSSSDVTAQLQELAHHRQEMQRTRSSSQSRFIHFVYAFFLFLFVGGNMWMICESLGILPKVFLSAKVQEWRRAVPRQRPCVAARASDEGVSRFLPKEWAEERYVIEL